jgi:hypothetical protein
MHIAKSKQKFAGDAELDIFIFLALSLASSFQVSSSMKKTLFSLVVRMRMGV